MLIDGSRVVFVCVIGDAESTFARDRQVRSTIIEKVNEMSELANRLK